LTDSGYNSKGRLTTAFENVYDDTSPKAYIFNVYHYALPLHVAVSEILMTREMFQLRSKSRDTCMSTLFDGCKFAVQLL